MRLASSGEEPEWANTSATKSTSFASWIVTIKRTLRSDFGVSAQIGGTNRFIAPQLVRLAIKHDAAGLEHIAAIGDRKPHARVLFNQQDGGVAADLRDDAEYRLHDHRREAERRLVEQQQTRF